MSYRGIAVVGSRKASDHDLSWTRLFGEAVAAAGYSVVSGGAKGIDQAAMFGALDRGGTVVGILADSLLRASSSKMYRSYLRSQDLVLVSPFNPEAGFTVGRAMQRNKYIYCLSDRALVVHSGIKGGTWEGAIENMKRQWVPIWVRQDSDGSGNAALLSVHHAQGPPQEVIQQICVSDQSATSSEQVEDNSLYADTKVGIAPSGAGNVSEQPEYPSPQAPSVISDLYGHFIQSLRDRLANGSIIKSELESHYGLVNSQFNTWMKRAVEGKVITESKPVMLSLNQQPEHPSPQEQEPSGSFDLYGRFIQSLCERLTNGSIEKSELESHYGLVKTQFDTWMNRAIEENVVKGSKPGVLYSLNQQPEHPTPQEQEPSGSSDLYGHFIQSLCDRLANGSIIKSELESHYGLVKTQFDTWMKRAIEENVVSTKSKPVVFSSLNQQPEHPTPQEQEPSGSSDLYGHFIQSLCDRLANGSIIKSELESHYGLVKTQFDTWMKRAIEENVVSTKSKPVVFSSLNQQPEHPTPQEQEPSGSSDLYDHFIQSLCDRLANGSIIKSELESHYGLVKTQFDTWMKRAIEEEQLSLPI